MAHPPERIDFESRQLFKPYPAYKDSGVEWLRKIPAHWESKRLKFAARLQYGESLSDEKREEGDIRVFGSNGQVGLHSKANTLGPALIIGRKGSYGKVNFSQDPCFAIDTTYFVDRHSSTDDLRWLWYALTTLRLDAFSEDSAVPGLSRDFAHSQWLPEPPVSEQHGIAAFLDRETTKIDALVAQKERLIELLLEKRAALITHAVTQGLPSTGSGQATPTVPMKDSGVEWLGEIPAHWETRRLKFLASQVTSGSRGWAEYYSDEGPLFLRIGNLERNGIDLDLRNVQRVAPPPGAEGERTKVLGGDLLVSITAFIGSVGVVPDDLHEGYVNQHIALARLVPQQAEPRWLGYCLLSQVGQRQFQTLLYGGTKEGLGLDDVKNLVVLLPSVAEQREMIAYLDRETAKLDALIAKVREGIERLKEYRSALISAAVTGKIDVREAV